MIVLPDILEIKRITQSLAMLDLIMSPDWEDRYYSFDSNWSSSEEMASMRNGSGDEWFLWFDSTGNAGLKGLAHESPTASIEGFSQRLVESVPPKLKSFSDEAAFNWSSTTFCYWWLAEDNEWQEPAEQVSVDPGALELLDALFSGAEGYRKFASDYYERGIDTLTIQKVFDQNPITQDLIKALNPDISIDEIREIGYRS